MKPTSVPVKTLLQSILSSATSFIPSSITGWDGVALTAADFGTRAFGAFMNSSKTILELFEYDPATIASPSITIIYRGLKFDGTQITEVTANKKDWPASDTQILLGTDTPQFLDLFVSQSGDETITGIKTFLSSPIVPTPTTGTQAANKAYADGLAIAGSPDSSTSTKGIGRVSVAPVSATIPIFVGDNDGRVPTQDENDALVGTSGAPSTSNKYITEADVSSAGVSGKVVRLNVTNYPVGDGSSITNTGLSSYTFGETISAGMPVYLKISDSKVYKASATASDELFWNYIGIAYESGIANDVKKVYVTSGSMITIPTLGATTTAISSASAVEQTNGSTANGYSPIYTGNFGQFGFISGATQGNIEKIVLTFGANTGTGGGSTQLNLYEVTSIDDVTSMVIGASLGSVTVGSPVASSNNTYTFSSPVTIKPNTQYAIRITAASGSGANYYTLNSNNTTISASFWTNNFNSATAINKVANDAIPQFNVFSTLTHNYDIGDYLYLGNTAGTFSFVGGTNKLIIGQIISATTIKLGIPSSRRLQGTSIIPYGANTGTTLPMIIPVLRNSVAVDMSISAGNTSATHVDNVNFEIGRRQTKVTTLGDTSGTGDYKITEIVTWGRGTITSTPSFASQNSWTTTAYFYK